MLLSGSTISVRRCNHDTVNPTLIQSGAGDKYREADTYEYKKKEPRKHLQGIRNSVKNI